MPVGIQALIPFAALLGGAAACRLPALRRVAGIIAIAATAIAAVMTALILAQLAPAERLAIPYLRVFPFMELDIEIDGLSLGVAAVMLLTGLLLLLVRLRAEGDRREPWAAWLLTEAASLAVLMAGNLLLLYAFLQIVTLAATGALDETTPRRRTFRLALQVSDLGLLLAAVEAVQAAGTSAIVGMPSEALGPVQFGLAVVPVVVRAVTLGLPGTAGLTPVRIEPALVQAAPAGYLILRLLAIAGGHPPVRLLQVLIFALGLLLAALFLLYAWFDAAVMIPVSRLLGAGAGIALALSSLGTPLGGLAACWMWATLLMTAGLSGCRLRGGRLAATLTPLMLLLIPPGTGFVAVFLAAMSLIQDHLLIGLIPLVLLAIVTTFPVARSLHRFSPGFDAEAGWAIGLLLAGAAPVAALVLVIPAARVVRPIPAGTVTMSWWGLSTTTGAWPAACAILIACMVLIAVERWGRLRQPAIPLPGRPRLPTFRMSWPGLWDTRTILLTAVLMYLLAVLIIVVR
jgi:hypothetical protein